MVRMTAVVFASFSLLPHGCSCSVAPRGQCCLLVPLQGVCVGGGVGWGGSVCVCGGGGGQNCRTCPGDCGPDFSRRGRTVEHALGTVVLTGFSAEGAEL